MGNLLVLVALGLLLGGVPCVCCVAVQHPVEDLSLSIGRLNSSSSRIAALHSSCRGRLHLRGAGYLATAACQGLLARASQPSSCDSAPLASRVVEYCNIGNVQPSRQCCSVVLTIIDVQDAGCLCKVEDEAEFAISYLRVSTIWRYYRACGGRQQRPPMDTDECEHASVPPPPPPPPTPPVAPSPPRPQSPPDQPPKRLSVADAVVLGVAIFIGTSLLLGLVALVVIAFKKPRVIPVPVPLPNTSSVQLTQAAAAAERAAAAAAAAAEGSPEEQRAVPQPPPLPFAPQPVLKEGEAPPAPPFIIPLPLPVELNQQETSVRIGGAT